MPLFSSKNIKYRSELTLVFACTFRSQQRLPRCCWLLCSNLVDSCSRPQGQAKCYLSGLTAHLEEEIQTTCTHLRGQQAIFYSPRGQNYLVCVHVCLKTFLIYKKNEYSST